MSAKVYYCTDDSAMGDVADLETGGLDYPLFVANDEYATLLREVEALRGALECATCLHIDQPGREGYDLHPLRQKGWNPSAETAPMFVARLARLALSRRAVGEVDSAGEKQGGAK